MKATKRLKAMKFTRFVSVKIGDFSELIDAIKQRHGEATHIHGFYEELHRNCNVVVLSNPTWPEVQEGVSLPEIKLTCIRDKYGTLTFEFDD